MHGVRVLRKRAVTESSALQKLQSALVERYIKCTHDISTSGLTIEEDFNGDAEPTAANYVAWNASAV